MKQFFILLVGIFALSTGAAESESLPEKRNLSALTLKVSEPVRGATDESKIPVLTKQKEKAVVAANPYFRMVMSLIIIAGMAIGLVLFSKWFGKRSTGKVPQQKIQMLSQLHLGPRKSLAVIRVSGESLLVGVTDHNIRLIKSLALMDDETEESEVDKGFQDHLEDHSTRDDEFDLSSIKDQITRKTSTMRPIL